MSAPLERRLETCDWTEIQSQLHPSAALRRPSGDMVHGREGVSLALQNFDWPKFLQHMTYENIHVGLFEGNLHLKVKYRDGLINRLYFSVVDPDVTRYRLDCAYDGTLYHGFQRQKKKPTVQGEIESVLKHITQERISVTPSGRTDRGVHADRQVIHFDTGSPLPKDTMEALLERMLPDDVKVLALTKVPNVFHARFDARMKTYHYTIIRKKDPFMAHYAWHRPGVDVERLNALLSMVEGTHDFAAFGKGNGDAITRRTIRTAHAKEEEGRIIVTIQSEGFLRHMVRYLVGTAIRDLEKGTEETVKALRTPSEGHVYLAPACGLTLHDVLYKIA